MADGADFAQVVAEAEDIARSVGHRLTTAHTLLAIFTVPNRGALLLKDRGIDEDSILGIMTRVPAEAPETQSELVERTRDIARQCGSAETDCLHLLIAMSRMKDCAAYGLLVQCGLEMNALRNQALSYFLGGRMPRRLQVVEHPSPPVRSMTPLPAAMPRARTSAAPEVAAPKAEPLAKREPPPELRKDSNDESSRPEPAARGPKAGPLDLDPKEFPLLRSLGRNLSLLASQKKLDPVVGRECEIEEVIDILGKRRTNNPCLIGEPGVGKTALVEGVAQRLLEVSRSETSRLIVELDMASVVAGTQLRGSFSEKMNAIKDEVKRAEGRVVVFIDEVHTVVGAGSTGEGPQDAANELKAALARGEFPCIGATTHDEYRRFIQQDPALERRFTAVMVREPTVPQTAEILRGIIGKYEDHHGLRYAKESLEAAAALAARYVSDRFLPDKAISVVDLAGSRVRREGRATVEAADVARVVSKLAGIPESRLLMTDGDRLLRLERDVSARVVGHAESISRVCQVIRRNYAGFSSRRPMGSFLLLGPPGVGKTELAKVLADVLFGSSDAMVRVDMTEASEAHAVSRLVGAPPGYVGYGDAGILSEPVRKRPSSIVVLDEIEKAHRDVLMLLLQVLDEGRLTDGRGRHIDFSNTVVILTSNLGAESFAKGAQPVGFQNAENTAAADRAQESARRQLPAELWNRLDERLVFAPLSRTEILEVARKVLDESATRLHSEKGIGYAALDDVLAYLVERGGFDAALGARPMRQAVQRMVEAPLAERILAGHFSRGDAISVRVRGGELAFERQ
jgi:ATP-dependent Clp protease ATP-binding subunit ClpC